MVIRLKQFVLTWQEYIVLSAVALVIYFLKG